MKQKKQQNKNTLLAMKLITPLFLFRGIRDYLGRMWFSICASNHISAITVTVIWNFQLKIRLVIRRLKLD